ncbi:hypothetical protein WME81_24735 [Sorangium sp. So ce1078]
MIADENGEPVAVLIYIGEVYNFRELRGELEGRGHHFRTHSDAEVVLRAYLEWGARGSPRASTACMPSPSGTSAQRSSPQAVE